MGVRNGKRRIEHPEPKPGVESARPEAAGSAVCGGVIEALGLWFDKGIRGRVDVCSSQRLKSPQHLADLCVSAASVRTIIVVACSGPTVHRSTIDGDAFVSEGRRANENTRRSRFAI